MKKRLPKIAPPPPRTEQSIGWFNLNRALATAAITVVAAIIAYRTGAQFDAGEVAFVFAVVYGMTWLGETLIRFGRKPRS